MTEAEEPWGPRSGRDPLPITLRPAMLADLSIIRAWLRRPEVADWWGPLESTEAEVRIALQSPSALCRIVEWDATPIGYAHAIDAAIWGADLPQDLEPGTWELDVVIADPAHRGRGAGMEALRLLRQEVFASTLATAVCVFVSIRHEAVVRAFEKAGFVWQQIWNNGALGPSWFMIARRP